MRQRDTLLRPVPGHEGYYYAMLSGEGALWHRDDEGGGTLLPPADGRYDLLEIITSEADAIAAAQEWEKQRPRG